MFDSLGRCDAQLRPVTLIPKLRRLRLELKLPRIIADDPHIGFRESVWSFGRDIQHEPDFRSGSTLELHHDCIKNAFEGFYRPHHVDFDRTVEPVRSGRG